MTDEEMAEEYLKKHNYTGGYIGYFASGYCKQAFLAGLKVGRPQWHDLRKDPNDLPKHSVRVLVLLEDKLYEISSISADNRWVCTDYYTGEDKVIAWCEIPTFDKE